MNGWKALKSAANIQVFCHTTVLGNAREETVFAVGEPSVTAITFPHLSIMEVSMGKCWVHSRYSYLNDRFVGYDLTALGQSMRHPNVREPDMSDWRFFGYPVGDICVGNITGENAASDAAIILSGLSASSTRGYTLGFQRNTFDTPCVICGDECANPDNNFITSADFRKDADDFSDLLMAVLDADPRACERAIEHMILANSLPFRGMILSVDEDMNPVCDWCTEHRGFFVGNDLTVYVEAE